MDIDSKYSVLQKKLESFGYTQPLPIGSISLVTTILEDLIKTTDTLKDYKERLKQLTEEKSAWELGVEPYKCDNTKLLTECNQLHSNIIKLRDNYNNKILELKRIIHNLEADKLHLEDHCAELTNKVQSIESRGNSARHSKSDGFSMNQKQPFISTVRSGAIIPKPRNLQDIEDKYIKCHCYNTANNPNKDRDNNNDAVQYNKCNVYEKIKNDEIQMYEQKIDERDQEIKRLTKLLTGGRPPAALANDCCFKGVNNLNTDYTRLLKEKELLENKLEVSNRGKHEAMERAMKLENERRLLTDQLEKIESTALELETEANSKIIDKDSYCNVLKMKLEKAKQKINNLQKQLKVSTDQTRDSNFSKHLKDENENLTEKLNRYYKQVGELTKENEKLTRKVIKLKDVLKNSENDVTSNVQRRNGHLKHSNIGTLDSDRINDANKYKSERDYYQKEYLNLLSSKSSDLKNVEELRQQLITKQLEIDRLTSQLMETKSQQDRGLSSNSVQAAMHRIEREKDILHRDLEHMKIERDELRDKLQLVTKSQIDEQKKIDINIEDYIFKISQLEKENRKLMFSNDTNNTRIECLRKDVIELKQRLADLGTENSDLRTSNNQMKILQAQSEKSLLDHQNRLKHVQCELQRAESRLSVCDSNRDHTVQESSKLKCEINHLKGIIDSLEHDKDKLLMDLDRKTEQLYAVEINFDKIHHQNIEFETKIELLLRKLACTSSKEIENEHTLRDISCETDMLRKQVSQLKHKNDNLYAENSRISSELSDVSSRLSNTQRKLHEADKEVDTMKNQLQQYVQEVQKAEDLLNRKEDEREEMLDQYRSLTQDAVVLEGNNQSLELQATEAKQNLEVAESKISELENLVLARENEVKILERQVVQLSKTITSLESDIDEIMAEKLGVLIEFNALKDVCEKIDDEKFKLNEELNECNSVRLQLEQENEKLRKDMISNTGGKAAVNSLQELLASSRKELEEQTISLNQVNQDVVRLKNQIKELQENLKDEQANSARFETLSKEYSIQVQELQRKLTDDRFSRVRSKEENDRYSSL